MDFRNFLIALEKAEDITTSVQDELNDDTPAEDEDDASLGKTDNIFGANEDIGNDTDNTDSEDDMSEDLEDDGGMDEDMSTEEDIDYVDEEPNPEVEKKIKLRENMILLHGILDSNIETLATYTPTQNTGDSSKILYDIVSNLSDSKKILFNEITNNFQTKSYPSLLKTYVAINRIYELAQKSLEKYFDGINIETPKKRKK